EQQIKCGRIPVRQGMADADDPDLLKRAPWRRTRRSLHHRHKVIPRPLLVRRSWPAARVSAVYGARSGKAIVAAQGRHAETKHATRIALRSGRATLAASCMTQETRSQRPFP